MVVLSRFVILEDLQPTIDFFPPRRPRFFLHTVLSTRDVPSALPPEHLTECLNTDPFNGESGESRSDVVEVRGHHSQRFSSSTALPGKA